ncbi:MAG: hypothetical protein K0V04_40690 [Deltaproteobacteria bacterium]|nr:hypothetical protein [Deltaproteobacteria bacterium]
MHRVELKRALPLAITILSLAVAAPAIAQSMKIKRWFGKSWTVDCAAVTFPPGEDCSSTCDRIDSKIGVSCDLVEGRMVVTGSLEATAAVPSALVPLNQIEIETDPNTSTAIGVEPLGGTVAVSAAVGTFVEVSDLEGTMALDGCAGPCVVQVSAEQGLLIQADSGDGLGQVMVDYLGS